MNIDEAYNHWASSYDTDENITRDLDAMATAHFLENRRFGVALELGCGTGKNTHLLSQKAKSVCALDFSREMLAKAKMKIEQPGVHFLHADLTKSWPVFSQSVDFIMSNLVLEHIQNLNFIFSEAARCLAKNGKFWVSEFHPFRQYHGKKARFEKNGSKVEITTFVHHVSDFVQAASENGFHLLTLKEWWHENNRNELPRLIAFEFSK